MWLENGSPGPDFAGLRVLCERLSCNPAMYRTCFKPCLKHMVIGESSWVSGVKRNKVYEALGMQTAFRRVHSCY